MAQQTQTIQDAYTYEVNFTTTNLSNGDIFIEPHEVTGPTPINVQVPLNAVTLGGGKVIVMPLTTNTSQGAYYIGFRLPQPDESKMYVTFLQKNSNYTGGYYMYTQGMTDSYRTAFRTFCRDNLLVSISSNYTFNKKVKFVVKGIDTNNVSASVEYQVWFRYVQNGTIVSIPNESNS